MSRCKTAFPLITFENINLTSRILKGLKGVILPHMQAVTRIITRIISEGITSREFRSVNPGIAAIHFLSAVRTTFVASLFIREAALDTHLAFNLFFEGLKRR